MANSLRRGFILTRARLSAAFSSTRSFSSVALVEIKPGDVEMVSGITEQHLRRRVGKSFDGRTSTSDPYANVGEPGLSFDSEEAAKAFAEKYGWEYVVKKRHTPILKAMRYASRNL